MNDSNDNDDGLRLVCRSDRFQPYEPAHRRLRAALADALGQCSRLAASAVPDRERTAAAIGQLLTLYAAHQAAEDEHLHAPLRERAPRALLAFDSEHADQLEHIAALRALLSELVTTAANAEPRVRELELRFSQFLAEGLAHMADEQTTLTRVLWQHFSDAELRALAVARDAAVAGHAGSAS